jgi:hypothetical protein
LSPVMVCAAPTLTDVRKDEGAPAVMVCAPCDRVV